MTEEQKQRVLKEVQEMNAFLERNNRTRVLIPRVIHIPTRELWNMKLAERKLKTGE